MRTILIICTCLLGITLQAQKSAQLDGYAYESGNRGFLNQVVATIYEMPDKIIKAEVTTMEDGHFEAPLEVGKTYLLTLKKDIFHVWDTTFTAKSGKNFFKAEMRRQPGYLFDVTLAEAREDENVIVDAVQGATIEVYNRTTEKVELVLKNHPKSFFQYTFEQGNYYTIMIRRVGYLTKRIDAHVNIDGCIICIDGVSNLRPGVTENLTENNTMGTLLANIELEKAQLNKKIEIKNIYYDLGKASIKPAAGKELDKVVTLLRDNPSMNIELGSHTDSRGSTASNDKLSQRRAESAVAYIISKGIDANRMVAKGFGETELTNECKDGVKCPEAKHALNRRTELRITGIDSDTLAHLHWTPLEQIIREEEFEQKMLEVQNAGEIKIGADGKPVSGDLSDVFSTETIVETEEVAEIEESSTIGGEMNNEEKLQPMRVVEEKEVLEEEKNTYVYSKVKFLPETFSGFNIQIMHSEELLPDSDPVLADFNSVFVYENKEAKQYEYYVGNFDTEFKAQKFNGSVVESSFPEAIICNFYKGKKLKCIEK